MGLLKKIKEKVKKEAHYQKLGYKEAGRRIKAGIKKSLDEAAENRRKSNAFRKELQNIAREAERKEMKRAARDLGKERARKKVKAALDENQGLTIRMPDLWGFEDGQKREQKKNNHS